MQRFIDKILLLTAGLALYAGFFGVELAVIPLLAAAAASLLSTLLSRDWCSAAIFAAFCIVCVFMPHYLCFLPLLTCDYKKPLWHLSALIALPLLILYLTLFQSLTVGLLFLFAAALAVKTRMTERLRADFFRNLDETKERSLALAEKNRELTQSREYQKSVAKLEERNRIAREIHDNVGHVLSSAILQTGALIAVTKDESAKEALICLKDILSGGMDDIRRSVHNLHEDYLDLELEIGSIASRFTFCPVDFRYSVRTVPSKRTAAALIAVVKETLSNIMKHSSATEAKISVDEQPGFFRLVVSDNGRGAKLGKGLGLVSIEERIRALGGVVSVTAAEGVRVYITVPKENSL